MPRIDSRLTLIEIPQMEINEKNELYIDEKAYVIVNNDLETADLVFEKGQWV